MKKFILSFLVIGTVGFYMLYLRTTGKSDVASTPVIQTIVPIDNSFSATTPTTKSLVVAKTATSTSIGQYKDGTYTGISANAYYGNIQVEAVINGGKLADVQFLDYPQDRRTSIRINNQAMPFLKQEAIQAQSANVDTVSGASDSSGAFRQSLASALSQAKNI